MIVGGGIIGPPTPDTRPGVGGTTTSSAECSCKSASNSLRDCRFIGEAGAFLGHPEARDAETGIHFPRPRIALDGDVAGVLAVDREDVVLKQMLLDRRWIPPALGSEAGVVGAPSFQARVCSL